VNFFSNKLNANKYFNIIKLIPSKIENNFILKNFGSLIGDKSFYKILINFELLNLIKKVKGDIIEFGIWNGNNLFTLKKIHDYYGLKKKIYGYDDFSGFPNPPRISKIKKNKNKGVYAGNTKLINFIKKFFNFKNLIIINDDIMNLDKHSHKFSKLSYIYIDCDIYKTTKKILNTLDSKLSVGGLFVFDEGICGKISEEPKALKEFYKLNSNRYKRIVLKKGYQPDIVLKKIRN
tara:strand:- start:1795 stop:2496 length:702 start_codon:yes stop_codon:yes gene_type:complete